MREVIRSSPESGGSSTGTRPTKIVPLGAFSPILLQTRNNPVGVLRLPGSNPGPAREVETGAEKISRWSQVSLSDCVLISMTILCKAGLAVRVPALS